MCTSMRNQLLRHPYTLVISGPTGCGKTVFLKKLLKQYNNFERVIYAYSMYQAIYDDIKKIKNVEFYKGFPSVETKGAKTLLVLDDLMMENDKKLALYFTKMRHANMSMIFVSQNFFFDSKYIRTVTRNAHYLVLFNNPRDVGAITTLGRQMFPDMPKFLPQAFRQATSRPYGYLFVDCKPDSAYRVLEGILSGEKLYIYMPT
jgi:hypothetical protein